MAAASGGDVIGIDLGTTNSCAAFVDRSGKVVLIPYRGGEFTVPSIYAIDQKGQELVGYEAKRQWQLNPKNTVYGIKRLIGHSFDSDVVARMRELVAFDLLAGPDNSIEVQVRDRRLTPIDISSRVLAKIRDVASTYFNRPVTRAVVTVPAYYNDRQRQAVKEAGRRAELEILGIINEPTSAALAFGAGKEREGTFAIFDLGGGTFDVSVIEIRNQVFEVKATGGDTFLGGLDFDRELMHFAVSEFRGSTGIDLNADPVAMQRIKDMAEQVKIELSSRAEARFQVPFISMTAAGTPVDLDLTVGREVFEELVGPLLDRALATCEEVIYAAGVEPKAIDEVLLVGGQTRMPRLQQRLLEYFGKPPSKQVHPDEAVAIGAALYAHSLADDRAQRLQLLDVIPMAIGIEDASGAMAAIFARNAPVPNQKALEFTTAKDNQEHLIMRLYQGDQERAQANELLGEFVFSGLRQAPRGQVRVETVFTLSVEGILSISARDLDTGARMEQSVSVAGIKSRG